MAAILKIQMQMYDIHIRGYGSFSVLIQSIRILNVLSSLKRLDS